MFSERLWITIIYVALANVPCQAQHNLTAEQYYKHPMPLTGDESKLQVVVDAMKAHKESLLMGHLVGTLKTRQAKIDYDATWIANHSRCEKILDGISRLKYRYHATLGDRISEAEKITLNGRARIINFSGHHCKDYPVNSGYAVSMVGGLKDVPHLHWYDLCHYKYLCEASLRNAVKPDLCTLHVADEVEHIRVTIKTKTSTCDFFFGRDNGYLISKYDYVYHEPFGGFPAGQHAWGHYEWKQTDGVWWPSHMEQYRTYLEPSGEVHQEQCLSIDNHSFEPEGDPKVSEVDFAMDKLPSGFLYTKRNALGRVLSEQYTGPIGKAEYLLKLKAARLKRGQDE